MMTMMHISGDTKNTDSQNGIAGTIMDRKGRTKKPIRFTMISSMWNMTTKTSPIL